MLILVPRCLEPGHNLAAIVGWHRARGGGVTLVTKSNRWDGIAAIDQALFQDPYLDPGAWNSSSLIALGGVRARAVSFPGVPTPAAVLLDRDGTIIVDRDYLGAPEGVTLLPGAADGLRLLAARGAALVVITNQSGLGRGRLTRAQVDAVHARLRSLLGEKGMSLLGIYVCPHQDDEGCACRKPGDRLARQAALDLGLSPDGAVVVGNKPTDIGLARRLDVPSFQVTTGCGAATLVRGDVSADYVVDGLDELARTSCHPAGLAMAAALPTG
jgi:histidinol-phosphate phosphatase family protein